MKKDALNRSYQNLAQMIVTHCVLNTIIREFDLNKKQMEAFNKEVVHKLYTFLQYTYNPAYSEQHSQFFNLVHSFFSQEANELVFDKGLLEAINNEK